MPDTGWVTIVIRPTAPPPRRTVKLQQTRSETGTRRQRSGKIRRRPRKLSSACNACGPESCKRRSRRWMIYIFVARSGPDPENCQLQRSAIYIFWLLQFSRLRPWFSEYLLIRLTRAVGRTVTSHNCQPWLQRQGMDRLNCCKLRNTGSHEILSAHHDYRIGRNSL